MHSAHDKEFCLEWKCNSRTQTTCRGKNWFVNTNKNNGSNTMVINYVPVSAVSAPLDEAKGILPIGAASWNMNWGPSDWLIATLKAKIIYSVCN